MKRTYLYVAGIIVALVPAVLGLSGNASFSQSVPVHVTDRQPTHAATPRHTPSSTPRSTPSNDAAEDSSGKGSGGGSDDGSDH